MVEYLLTYSLDLNPIEHKWAQAKSKKKRERLRHKYFVLTPHSVIKIKSLSYITDIEFLAQYLVLRHAAEKPELTR